MKPNTSTLQTKCASPCTSTPLFRSPPPEQVSQTHDQSQAMFLPKSLTAPSPNQPTENTRITLSVPQTSLTETTSKPDFQDLQKPLNPNSPSKPASASIKEPVQPLSIPVCTSEVLGKAVDVSGEEPNLDSKPKILLLSAPTTSNPSCTLQRSLDSPLKLYSPRKRKASVDSVDDETQSMMSTTINHTEPTLGKRTPLSLDTDHRRYLTRFSIREDKRLFGARIKICEENNTIKNFYKRRNITTDFEFNPRFDKPRKRMKVTVKLPSVKKDPSFHMRLRKRQSKAIAVKVREIRKQTPSILKPDPLRNRFW
ncbi:unnamed protein product [Moneuplotes crassus]|uniref:Uncharacterized protein n=1 Tax=Euplotes crassus TaxID=5936 RepID=A0AAD1UQB5_EUPCR|nr:unnamed protein product [Moneuplotes crassus]